MGSRAVVVFDILCENPLSSVTPEPPCRGYTALPGRNLVQHAALRRRHRGGLFVERAPIMEGIDAWLPVGCPAVSVFAVAWMDMAPSAVAPRNPCLPMFPFLLIQSLPIHSSLLPRCVSEVRCQRPEGIASTHRDSTGEFYEALGPGPGVNIHRQFHLMARSRSGLTPQRAVFRGSPTCRTTVRLRRFEKLP